MANYGKEKNKEHLALIKRTIARNPNISILQIQKVLEKQKDPLHLHQDYINKLVNKIRGERARRYDNMAKNEAIAKFEDFLDDLGGELNRIISDPESQTAKIMAIKQKVENYKSLLNLQFDMGIFERELGKTTNEIVNVAEIIKLIKDVQFRTIKDNSEGNQ